MNQSSRKIMFLSFCFLGLSAFTIGNDIHSGTKVKIGEGEAFVFITLDNATQAPSTLGIELTGRALQGLSHHMEKEYILPMPQALTLPPYQHVVVNWNPHGHFPNDIYGAPHFDFHFYLISSVEREKIVCDNSDIDECLKMPLEEEVAPYYVPAPDGVPKMGWHWVDSRAPELNGKPFTTTFIYGYYDSKLIFLEPMMTRLFILKKSPFTEMLSVPAKVLVTGYYPQSYDLRFDSPRDVFQVTLSRLVYSLASPKHFGSAEVVLSLVDPQK